MVKIRPTTTTLIATEVEIVTDTHYKEVLIMISIEEIRFLYQEKWGIMNLEDLMIVR